MRSSSTNLDTLKGRATAVPGQVDLSTGLGKRAAVASAAPAVGDFTTGARDVPTVEVIASTNRRHLPLTERAQRDDAARRSCRVGRYYSEK